MDDLRTGSLARAVRHRLRWTQADVAARAGVSQKLVSLFETGRVEQLTVASARRIAAALEIRLPFAPQWRGGDGTRLLDADHATLVNRVVGILAASGWETLVEYSFSEYGERGSVDVVGWHASRRALLISEIKPRLLDSQETLGTLGRKVRIVPRLLARDRGWRADRVGVALVLADLTANRAAVSRHTSTFAAALPQRGRAVRDWLREPGASLAGVWFLSPSNGATGTQHRGARRRVRRSRPRLGLAAQPS